MSALIPGVCLKKPCFIPGLLLYAPEKVWLWKGGICLDYEKQKIESIRRRYPAGTQICLDEMEGEPQMPAGLKGEVFCVE